ncbi:unnamed protein product [Danaus chrysippus]|uniref:(African queen) hypothetical protein n=1 Tax=Danaus chrysippus TaxID=151541 RepID=A0A8J2R2J8_9NEOP|nr:unnamed protein product [Danaus chrysippus]
MSASAVGFFLFLFIGIPTGPAVTAVIKTYIEQGESNVVLLNWDYLASKPLPSLASSYVNFAVPNARQLGVRLASTFLDLKESGMDLNKTHLIGHSLGAHILGIAGNHLAAKGVLLPWITGLDPAAVGFENKAARLYQGSALFVDVIHTDPNKYGTSMPSGTVDFWPNFKSGWPIIQPGCGRKPAPALSKEESISDEPLQAYRAIKILKPTTDLSGNYTCVVSTFIEEDRQTRPMLVYSPGRNFNFVQEKKYVFLVTLICTIEDVYPKPEVVITAQGIPLKQSVSEMKMDSWGLYTVTVKTVVHDDDVITPSQEYVCTLSIPSANYTISKTTTYYPGLMPTTYIAAFEIQKPQERQANGMQYHTILTYIYKITF